MKKQINERGFHLIMIPLLVVVVGIIGFAGWYVWNSQKDNNPDNGTTPTPTILATLTPTLTPSPLPSIAPEDKVNLSIADYLWGNIDFQAPKGWEKLTEDGTQIFRTIDGVHYQIMFDVQSEDQLKNASNTMSSDNAEATATTSNGTKIYIVKFNHNELLGLSSCMPSLNAGCSFRQGDKYLLIYASVSGYEGPYLIDFTKASANTLIRDMQEIASSLPF